MEWMPIPNEPELERRVLVLHEEGHIQIARWAGTLRTDDETAWICDDGSEAAEIYGDPTHWMPLPEPPKC